MFRVSCCRRARGRACYAQPDIRRAVVTGDVAESRVRTVGVAVINRRTVLAGAGIAAGGGKPNILVIVVDQMRAPQWFPDPQKLDALLPNVARLRNASISFESHYTASNMCAPSRGVMTTGLYSHQTGCLFTGDGPSESSLAPRFPTWGTMLREQGYRTWWWGKRHLGQSGDMTPEGLDAHGFSGGTFPSPNGAPNQGLQMDPGIMDQFAGWFDDNAGRGPWCTTVSLVNPHDICWWPKNSLPEDVPRVFESGPVNFETPDDLRRRAKPPCGLSSGRRKRGGARATVDRACHRRHVGRGDGHIVEVPEHPGVVRDAAVAGEHPDVRAQSHRGGANPRGETGCVLVLEARQYGHRHVTSDRS